MDCTNRVLQSVSVFKLLNNLHYKRILPRAHLTVLSGDDHEAENLPEISHVNSMFNFMKSALTHKRSHINFQFSVAVQNQRRSLISQIRLAAPTHLVLHNAHDFPPFFSAFECLGSTPCHLYRTVLVYRLISETLVLLVCYVTWSISLPSTVIHSHLGGSCPKTAPDSMRCHWWQVPATIALSASIQVTPKQGSLKRLGPISCHFFFVQ